jgi:hypothetical protein
LSKLEAGFYRPIDLFSLPYALYAFSVGYSLGPSVAELHDRGRTGVTLLAHWPAILLVAALFGVGFLVGLARARRYCGRFSALPILLLVLPVLFPVLVTLMSRVTFNARYAIVSFPAYLMFLGIGLSSLRFHVMSRLLEGGIAALMVTSLVANYCDPVYAKADSRAAFHLIEARKRPGDCVLVIGVTEAFRHYEEGALQSRWLDFRQRDRLRAAEEALREWSMECSGLWLVAGRTWEVDPFDVVDDLISKYFRLAEKGNLPGLRIVQYHSLNFPARESHPSAARDQAPTLSYLCQSLSPHQPRPGTQVARGS